MVDNVLFLAPQDVEELRKKLAKHLEKGHGQRLSSPTLTLRELQAIHQRLFAACVA